MHPACKGTTPLNVMPAAAPRQRFRKTISKTASVRAPSTFPKPHPRPSGCKYHPHSLRAQSTYQIVHSDPTIPQLHPTPRTREWKRVAASASAALENPSPAKKFNAARSSATITLGFACSSTYQEPLLLCRQRAPNGKFELRSAARRLHHRLRPRKAGEQDVK